MKLDINKIFEDIENSFDKETTIDNNTKIVAAEISTNSNKYSQSELNVLKLALKRLHLLIIDVKKQSISSLSFIDKINEINLFTEKVGKIIDDCVAGYNPFGYTSEEFENLKNLIDELHRMHIDSIRNGIFTASNDNEKLSNASFAISDLDVIIKNFNNGINNKKYTFDQIDRLVGLQEKLNSFKNNYKANSKSTTASTKNIPSNLFDNLNNIESQFVCCIYKRDLDGIIENDTKFNTELNRIKTEYATVDSLRVKIADLRDDHDLSYAFFTNNINPGTDVRVLIEDVEMTVSSINELLSKEKKSTKDYDKLSALLNEFNEKYISTKSYILGLNDSNNKLYLSRLEYNRFRCDAAKKELDKQHKHAVIDKRRAAFKFFGAPLGLSLKIITDSFTTAFPEAKGVNDKISKFNLNDFAFKHLKFLEYEEDYSNMQKGKDYWKGYNDLNFFEKTDKFATDFKVFETLFKPFKLGFDYTQSKSEDLINNAIGGKKK